MIGFPVNETVQKRYSVRTYAPTPVEEEVKEKITAYMEKLENPLGPKARFQLIEKETGN